MKTRTNKFRGKRVGSYLIALAKETAENTYYLLVSLLYIILKSYIEFEKAFIKMWKMFPKWFKRVVILVMLVNISVLNDKAPEIIEKIITNIEIKEVYAVKEIMVEPKKCEWGIYECAIYDTALEYGLNEEQAKIAVAITKHETKNYTSLMFKNKNNIGGLYNSTDKCFYSYNSVEDGIDAHVRNLKRLYIDKGLDTIEKIQTKYAPLDVENDPNGLNAYWVDGVTHYYNELI